MAKVLAYWHVHALNFTITAAADFESGAAGRSSYVLESGDIRLVLTSAYPPVQPGNEEIARYIAQNYCGVKRIAVHAVSVSEAFNQSVAAGAIPVALPGRTEDKHGYVEEAAVRLYDQSEIVFINRDGYTGAFKPGYAQRTTPGLRPRPNLAAIDHIAGEVRINEMEFWSQYLGRVLGTRLVQRIERSEENRTGMVLNINQSPDKKLTFVLAEPETHLQPSKIQQNIDRFGPGIHHLAFSTTDMRSTVAELGRQGVEFVKFPASYFDLLRDHADFKDFDIDELQENGILIDKEGDSYLLQKFVKPISDRPFFLYEIVQRVNGYSGFALKNINVLKKAEELEIMRTAVR